MSARKLDIEPSEYLDGWYDVVDESGNIVCIVPDIETARKVVAGRPL